MALTDDDIARIQGVLENLVTKQEFEELKEQISGLPTRKEFLDLMSELMGEVKDERDENTILDGRTAEQEIRLSKLEKIHPHGRHATA